MDAIAERANVSKRTVYKHFDGKDALFTHMVTVMRAGFKSAVATTFDPSISIEIQLRSIAEAQGELFSSKSFMRLVRLLVSEAGRDRAIVALFPNDEADGGALASFMEAASANGVLTIDDADLAAIQFKELAITSFANADAADVLI